MTIKSKFRPVELPEVPLHQAVFSRFPKFGKNVALVDALTGQKITYKQLIELQPRVSSGLVRLGLEKGDVVLICSPNSLEITVILYGVWGAGGTVTSMNPNYTIYEMTYQIKDCQPKFIYTVPHMVEKLAEVSKDSGVKPIILTTGDKGGCISYSQLIEEDGSVCPSLKSLNIIPKEDLACILYSSGTTGLSKGAMLTHFNITSNLMQVSHDVFQDPTLAKVDPSDPATQEVVINYLPPFHVYGLVCLNVFALARGAKVVTLPKFDIKNFLWAIQRYKVSLLNAVPPISLMLARHPLVSEHDLSSVKAIHGGAAPLSRQIEKEVTQRLHISPYRQLYGMTETSPSVLMHPFSASKPGSVGMVTCNTEVKVMDPITKNELGPNEQGELWVRGPQVMKGYLNKPEATQATIDKDGWLHTGDVVYYDDDEYFYIVDRIKELIKYNAYQIPPAELEALLLEHPAIADAAVIGIPDPTAGEVPRAYVVKKPNIRLTEQDIHDFVKERAISYKWLRGGVIFVKDIPKLGSGKILRRKLKKDAMNSRL